MMMTLRTYMVMMSLTTGCGAEPYRQCIWPYRHKRIWHCWSIVALNTAEPFDAYGTAELSSHLVLLSAYGAERIWYAYGAKRIWYCWTHMVLLNFRRIWYCWTDMVLLNFRRTWYCWTHMVLLNAYGMHMVLLNAYGAAELLTHMVLLNAYDAERIWYCWTHMVCIWYC